MKIWFLEIGEPLPFEKDVRLHRYGEFTQYLAKCGHDVTWWTSTFSHAPKKHIFNESCEKMFNGVRVKLIKGLGYRKNISFARFKHQADFAEKFKAIADHENNLPDLIIAPIPTLEVAEQGVSFALKNKIPVLTDIRDEWPEEFVDIAPKLLRPLARLVLYKSFRQVRFVCSNCTGIMAMSERQLQYGLKYSNRSAGENEGLFPLGYKSENQISEDKLKEASIWWKEKHGLTENDFNICFFGTIGKFFDLSTLISSAKALKNNLPVKFVLCGDGRDLEKYKQMAQGLENVVFPGWVDGPKISALMRLSKAGIAPYALNTRMSLPNKPFEYMAGGLPIISSIEGELTEVLKKYGCGFTYKANNVDELNAIIEKLYLDPRLRLELGSNARKTLEEHYSMESIFARWEKHLCRVVNTFNKF